jgi:tetratricopeptide (TPR) repeat protein
MLRFCSAIFVATAAFAGSDAFRDLLERAFRLHEQRQYSEAIPVLRQAWQLERKDYFVNFLLGVDLLRTGQREQAVPFLKEASRFRPEEEFPYEYLGESHAGLGQYADAAIAYRNAVQVAPESAEAIMGLAHFSLARFAALARQRRSSRAGLAAEYRLQALARPLGDPTRATLLRRAAELDEDARGIWSEIAISDIARGDLAAAAHDVERATSKNPSDLQAWEAEALIAAHKGDWTAAAAKLNDIARHSQAAVAQALSDWPAGLDPPGSDGLLKEVPKPERPSGKTAAVLFKEQRWEVLASVPAPPLEQKQAWYFRGAALARTGDCGSAIPALERGLGDHPGGVDGMFLLSWCYAREAGAAAKRVEKAGSDPVLIHLMRGDVLLRLQGNSEAALAEYQAAVTARPQDASALARLAEAQAGAGQLESARQSAEAALRLDPHLPPATRTMAEIAMQERNYSAALPYLRELASADPGDVATRVQLGTACAQTGSLEEALRNLAPALAHGYPDKKGSLHYLLGTVLRRLGRTAEAAQAFETARQLSDAFQRNPHREQDERP